MILAKSQTQHYLILANDNNCFCDGKDTLVNCGQLTFKDSSVHEI
jgi:hypothetical protein